MMKTPVGLVTVALAAAILLAIALLITTGTRGSRPRGADPVPRREVTRRRSVLLNVFS